MSRYLLPLMGLALLGCKSLEPIEQDVCGNEVLEAEEDCDVHVDDSLGTGLRCGVRDTAAQCRYVCETAASCPTGWGCGLDGVCRQASGSFRAGQAFGGWTPSSFQASDWNGDGWVDLVGAFEQHVEFRPGEEGGTFAEGHALPTPPVTGAVSVGQLDGDGYGDTLLPTPLGFLVWRGQSEGQPLQVALAPVPLDSDQVWIIPARYPNVGPQGFLIPVLDVGENVGAALFNYATWQTTSPITLSEGATVAHLGDRVPAIDLNGDTDDELVFAFRGHRRITAHGIRHDALVGQWRLGGYGASGDMPVEVDVSTPLACTSCSGTPCEVDTGVRTGDVDGNGSIDLLLGLTCGSTPLVAVVSGRGNLGFGEPYVDDRFESTGLPLAAGDLNGDGFADYVASNGVFMTDPDTSMLTLTEEPDPEQPWNWTHATLADVDGDGSRDIVGFTFGEPFIDVLRCGSGTWGCVESGRFISEKYKTDSGVKKLRTGQLQGGPAEDIVFVEGEAGEDDALSVMFSDALSWPEKPVRRARFQHIEQLEIAPAPIFGQTYVDLFEDVQLTIVQGDAAIYSHLYAGPAQQLNSPLILPDSTGLASDIATGRQALPGRYSTSGEDRDDLVLIGQRDDNTPRAWLVPRAKDAFFPPPPQGQVLLDDLGDDFEIACARFTTGDTDGDDRHEVVVVYGAAICPEKELTRLALGRELDGRLVFDVRELELDPGSDSARVVAANLDEVAGDELVVAQEGSAYVFSGGAAVLASDPTPLELPDGAVLDLIKIARAEGERGPSKVAVLISGAVGLIAKSPSLSLRPVAEADAYAVRSADVDRDGLSDLLLLGEDGLRVLLSVAAPPLGGPQP